MTKLDAKQACNDGSRWRKLKSTPVVTSAQATHVRNFDETLVDQEKEKIEHSRTRAIKQNTSINIDHLHHRNRCSSVRFVA